MLIIFRRFLYYFSPFFYFYFFSYLYYYYFFLSLFCDARMAQPPATGGRKRPCALGPAFCLDTVVQHHHGHDEPASRGAAQCDAMSRVLEHLYLGSWRDSADKSLLEREGITHVLDCAKENEVPQLRPNGSSGDTSANTTPETIAATEGSAAPSEAAFSPTTLLSKKLPMVDDHSQDIDQHLDAAYQFIEMARQNNGRVLVHCRRGISRSPAIVVAYLMRYRKMPYEEALAAVKDVRTTVSLNMAFREFLSTYDPHVAALQREVSNTASDLPAAEGLSAPAAPTASFGGSSAPVMPTPEESPGTE